MLSLYRFGGFVRFFRLVRRGGFASAWVGPGWYRLYPTPFLFLLANIYHLGNFWEATPSTPTKKEEERKRETTG